MLKYKTHTNQQKTNNKHHDIPLSDNEEGEEGGEEKKSPNSALPLYFSGSCLTLRKLPRTGANCRLQLLLKAMAAS